MFVYYDKNGLLPFEEGKSMPVMKSPLQFVVPMWIALVPLLLLLLLPLAADVASAQSQPILVEAEEFANLAGWQRFSSASLGNTPCSRGQMIRCGSGKASTTIQIPTAGVWHVWVRSHGEPSRGVRVRVGQEILRGVVGQKRAGWAQAGQVELRPGPVTLTLTEAKGGPYVDVFLLTREEGCDPAKSVTLASPPTLKKAAPTGNPECVRKIDLADFGGIVVRYGDLDGDGEADAVVFQNDRQKITCVTAINLRGRILWQRGKPDARHAAASYDVAAQIYDLDGDGRNEVLVIEDKTLRILDGRTGQVKREHPVPANDSLLIANFSGARHHGDLLIKDRYSHIWVFDNQLRPLWDSACNCGHYPLNIDLDHDGREELICGYRLYSHDGRVLWDHPEFGEHNDAVDAQDMNGDGVPEIAIACSGPSALLAADGRVLFTKPHRHSQHAVIGAFCPERKGRQVVFVDRGADGTLYCYTHAGEELWQTPSQGWLTIASTIDGWTGEPGRSYLLLYRRSSGPPILLDGKGQLVAEFPFPPAAKHSYDQYFVQHFDVLGDAREELLVNCSRAIWCYTNAAPPPPGLPAPRSEADPRIYNASFYVGRQ